MILYLTFRPQNYNLFRISHLKECKNSKLPYVFKSYYNLHMEIIPKVVTLAKVFASHTQGMGRIIRYEQSRSEARCKIVCLPFHPKAILSLRQQAHCLD